MKKRLTPNKTKATVEKPIERPFHAEAEDIFEFAYACCEQEHGGKWTWKMVAAFMRDIENAFNPQIGAAYIEGNCKLVSKIQRDVGAALAKHAPRLAQRIEEVLRKTEKPFGIHAEDARESFLKGLSTRLPGPGKPPKYTDAEIDKVESAINDANGKIPVAAETLTRSGTYVRKVHDYVMKVHDAARQRRKRRLMNARQ